jgi:hypothetical protein
MRQFRQLPRRLAATADHAGSIAVQPLAMLADALVNRRKHPFYDGGRGAEAEFFLAFDASGRAVGRIAALIDHRYNTHMQRRDPGHELVGQFGFFECVNSPEPARLLIAAAADWLRSRSIRRMLGPASPSQSYDYGMLVEGFDKPHRFLQPYNPAYYPALIEGCGLTKAKDLLSLTADLHDPASRAQLEQFIERSSAMAARSSLKVTMRPINMRRYREEAADLCRVLNESLPEHFGHSPIAEAEWRDITDSLRPFVKPDLVLFAERAGKTIGAVVAIPDLNEIIRKIRLRVGLLEPLEFLARSLWHKPTCICVAVLGISRSESNFAVAPMLVGQLVRNVLATGVRFIDAHQVLEDNRLILEPLLRTGLKADRRYRIYQLPLV